MQINPDFSLAAHNTLALAAQARAFARVESLDELRQARVWARAEGLGILPLGEGSNVVFAGDVDALVMQLASRGRQLLDSDDTTHCLRVAAGENWHAFVTWAVGQGYSGLANLALIPGTVGAAPIQNIGAYGVELEQFVEAVQVVHLDSGVEQTLSAADCGFAYRDSIFKRELTDVVVTAVDFRLPLKAPAQARYPSLAVYLEAQGITEPGGMDVYNAVVAIRGARLPDPATDPNAGSFFKNPVVAESVAKALAGQYSGMPTYPAGEGRIKIPAAWLIEQAGWKGEQRNGVGVHPGHALVLVNYGANSGARLLELARAIQLSVQERFGVALEMEPRVYGEVQGAAQGAGQ
ncbi:UDP-N-acetylmuramate dehydrogenase [Parahaliea maris]|uniref:UDP-N-acetylenolpyruvoylglucosamine reductase n=1 Tax=Parahaliea maris TaxID=2716870 RepID=A0A5C8ZZF2_9GAMM|nr:UDP-N-acetylmuramate dehydrogenase [Parahaliea maris]TXS93002.1 UDP-N-acetylmuramate dehydrogenase [Parahaliea maris]